MKYKHCCASFVLCFLSIDGKKICEILIEPLNRNWLKDVHLFNASNVREVCNEFQPNTG